MKDINKTLSKLGWDFNTNSSKAQTLAIEDRKSLPPDCTQALGKAKDKLNDVLNFGKKWIQTLKELFSQRNSRRWSSSKPEDSQVTKTSLSE